MRDPVLHSDSFERAASSLRIAMETFAGSSPLSFDVERFERSVDSFRMSVDKLSRVLGMKAENDQRKSSGLAMAYTESDFFNA